MRENGPINLSPTSSQANAMPHNQFTDEIQIAREENSDLVQQLCELQKTYSSLEQLLIESKLQAATLDMEADELTVELSQKNEILKMFSAKCTQYEVQVQELQSEKTQLEVKNSDKMSR